MLTPPIAGGGGGGGTIRKKTTTHLEDEYGDDIGRKKEE
jgi:hypothetical protein